ncbi:MAG: hypothetical protein E7033_03335 [Akkermansiaceae bacterium]|nr:hypothetical protein [Akkermansiaceae bacterium]
MIKHFAPLTTSVVIACGAAATAQDTHLSLANEIINLLSETEICLNLCRDAQSVQDVLPQLADLQKRAQDLKKRQNALPDITPEDDKQIAPLIKTFITLQDAITAHLQRISAEQLLTPELLHVIYPTSLPPTPTPPNTTN